jgi:hypothetical protein
VDDYKNIKLIYTFFNILLIVVVLALVGLSIFFLFDGLAAKGESVTTFPTEEIVVNNDEAVIISTDEELPEEEAEEDLTLLVGDPDQKVVFNPNSINGYIPNPGMGWVYQWGDTELPEVESSVAYSVRREINWQELNPAEGVFNWEILDAQIELAKKQGKQYSFRVYTMVGEEFDGHQVPAWVVDKGALILSNGEPDYSSCVYQEEWATFVDELIYRYDGNPDIAFIDISGYGNFNEWNWSDSQTTWDQLWQDNYEAGVINLSAINSLDGLARRRLADMFIGGSNDSHRCKNADSQITQVNYAYAGFQSTQLVMPFAGIVQSTQYVFSQDPTVGFRHDCLGRASSNSLVEQLRSELNDIWRNAPVVYETCSPDQFSIGSAYYLLENSHASLIHNVNIENLTAGDALGLSALTGYKYNLAEIEHPVSANAGDSLELRMVWENSGRTPSYLKMGQAFQLVFYLVNKDSGNIIEYKMSVDISQWMPSDEIEGNPPENQVDWFVEIPSSLAEGRYIIKVAIIDKRTGAPINLAIDGQNDNGVYTISEIIIFAP